MDKTELKYKVITLLKTLDVYDPNSLETQHVVRCPYCGDSRNPMSGHFSIKIDVNSDDGMVYRCFKCPESGLLTADTLADLNLFLDDETSISLKSYNRKLIKKNKFMNTTVKNYAVPISSETKLNLQKLEYLSKRLGYNFSLPEATSLKIILDLKDFLKTNEIKEIPMVSDKYLNFINYNYIGFLCMDNNTINFRCFRDDKSMKRYIKTKIDPNNIHPASFYGIPNQIDPLYNHDINIHIAEGVFDIDSIFLNVMNSNRKNNFYYASCGFTYLTVIKYLVYNGINTGINLHIYSDNDKTEKDHRDYLFYKSSLGIWCDNIYIHYNRYKDEKDYGVPKEKIIDTFTVIK